MYWAIFAMFAAKYLQYGGFAIVLAILMVTVFKGIIPVWLAIIICVFGTAGVCSDCKKLEQGLGERGYLEWKLKYQFL